jgi:hypothetical protein
MKDIIRQGTFVKLADAFSDSLQGYLERLDCLPFPEVKGLIKEISFASIKRTPVPKQHPLTNGSI